MSKRIWLSLARMGGHELDFIKEAFDTNWIVPLGPNVDGFEQDLSSFLDGNLQVVALSSGTAALHLGLILLGVEAGNEVICQSFTFAASANPIAYLGARPVFVDSEPDSWNMDPEFLEEAIKERLAKTGKLRIPVHLYGMPANMEAIMKIAGHYHIPVLEDAAEALGSELDGRKCGTFGQLAVLSFNGNKIITTSGGGALVCRTEEQATKAKFYATQARDQAPHYQHSKIGYNYRMSNICAGIGRGQMLVLEEFIARRRAIHEQYKQLLSGINGVRVMDSPSVNYQSNFWLTCLQVDPEVAGFTREDLRLDMEAANIEARPLWKPMHLQPVFKDAPFYSASSPGHTMSQSHGMTGQRPTSISEELFNKGLCLPSGPNLSQNDLERIVTVFRKMKPKP